MEKGVDVWHIPYPQNAMNWILIACIWLGISESISLALCSAAASSEPVKFPKERRPRIPTTADRRWEVRPIGKVESPYLQKFGTPKQATVKQIDGGKVAGKIHIYEEFRECLHDVDEFDYIWALTLMHLNNGFKTKIKPRPRQQENYDNEVPAEVGLFSCRAPHRPNPIAISALEVVSVDVENGIVEVFGLDLLNDTPILDIKPYVPAFDSFPGARAGWMDAIFENPLEAREKGYQHITSSRGRRQADKEKQRAEYKKALEKQLEE